MPPPPPRNRYRRPRRTGRGKCQSTHRGARASGEGHGNGTLHRMIRPRIRQHAPAAALPTGGRGGGRRQAPMACMRGQRQAGGIGMQGAQAHGDRAAQPASGSSRRVAEVAACQQAGQGCMPARLPHTGRRRSSAVVAGSKPCPRAIVARDNGAALGRRWSLGRITPDPARKQHKATVRHAVSWGASTERIILGSTGPMRGPARARNAAGGRPLAPPGRPAQAPAHGGLHS